MFFSAITKNSNWESLTKNLVTFKRSDVLRMKNFNIFVVHWKIRLLDGVYEKPITGGLLKKGELGQLLDLKGGFARKGGGGVFLRRLIPQCTLCMTTHHAEPNNILLTRNLSFHSDVWQWSHPLMVPLHCLWAK